MASEAQRRELLELILEVSFRREEVTLASGKQSDFYLDLRQTLMRPRGVELAGELVLERLRAGPPVDSVGGMAVGAVPLVSAILAAAAARDAETPLIGFFVRKQAKQHGLGKRIEGASRRGRASRSSKTPAPRADRPSRPWTRCWRRAARSHACCVWWTAARAPSSLSPNAGSNSRVCSTATTCRSRGKPCTRISEAFCLGAPSCARIMSPCV